MSPAALVRVLIAACHPVPTLAVTVFATALAVAAGNSGPRCALVAAAVLTGQLSIGWSNDRIDVARDRHTGRADKPLVRVPSLRPIEFAVAVALAATIAFSLWLGLRAGVVHLVAVACAWAYNLRLKSTVLSWAPYAVAFGALPAVATLTRPGHPAPALWAVVAGALLGVTAHLANAVPDLADDRATGVIGAPHRLGASRSLALAGLLAAAATLVVVLGRPGALHLLDWFLLAAAAAVTAAGALAGRRPGTRLAFPAVIVVVAVDLVLVLTAGHALAA